MAEAKVVAIPAVSVTIDKGELIVTFASGAKQIVNTFDLTGDIREYAMMHGLKQKIVDAAAIPRNLETGLSASPWEKEEAVRVVIDRLRGGEWNAPKTEGGANGGLLFRALCEFYPDRAKADVQEFVRAMTKEQQAAMRANKKIAKIIEKIKAAETKVDKSIDVDALLAGFNG